MSNKNDYVAEWQKLKNEKASKEVLANFLRKNKFGLTVDYSHRELIK